MSAKKITPVILAFLIFIFYFFSFSQKIAVNQIPFYTDEMYWISTGKIIQVLFKPDFTSDWWHENWGFANFNGAKLIYGIGLTIAGYHNFVAVGVAPETYYKWQSYDGLRFPQTHRLFGMLSAARQISAFFTALSLALLFILVYQVFNQIIPAAVAVGLMGNHPGIEEIGTHALADSMLIFFELSTLLLTAMIIRGQRLSHSRNLTVTAVILGLLWAMCVSVKINAILVVFASMILLFLNRKRVFLDAKTTKSHSIGFVNFLIISLTSMMLTFFVLHPNFFFYPNYSLINILIDRVAITKYHMQYFGRTDPSHVLPFFPGRIWPFLRLTSTIPIVVCAVATLIANLFNYFFRQNRQDQLYFHFCVVGLIFVIMQLTYFVFAEIRYVLPGLPFVILAISNVWPFSGISPKQHN